MATFLNHVAITLPRNGTTAHTFDPSDAANAVAGAAFTPTAGRLLVAVGYGPVTFTTASGWAQEDSAVNYGGLYLWSRDAAGGDTFDTIHSASNYPAVVEFFEFAAGSSLLASASAINGAGASVSFADPAWAATALGRVVPGDGSGISAVWSQGSELVDASVSYSTTEGFHYALTQAEGVSSPWSPSATLSGSSSFGGPITDPERIAFAVDAVDGGGGSSTDGLLTAPPASSSLAATPPTFRSQTIVSGDAAELQLFATAPSFLASKVGTLAAPAAVLALSASAPVLTASTSGTLTAPAAVAALGASAPTFRASRSGLLQVPAAAITLGASSPTLVATKSALIQAPAARIDVLATAPSFRVAGTGVLAAVAGTVSLSATPPTFRGSRNAVLAAPPAALSLSVSGVAFLSEGSARLVAPSAAISLTATAPAFRTGQAGVLVAPAAALSLLATAPGLPHGGTLVAPAAVLSLRSRRPSFKARGANYVPVLVFPDPLLAVLGILRAATTEELSSASFGTVSPSDLGDDFPGYPYVTAELAGTSTDFAPFFEDSTIRITAWHERPAKALRLLQVARAVLVAHPGPDLVRTSRRGPLSALDPETGTPISYADITIRLRPTPLD